MNQPILPALGWNNQYQLYREESEEPLLPAGRVSHMEKGSYTLMTDEGELTGLPAGRLYSSGDPLPSVGDWVLYRKIPGEKKAVIQAMLPRKNRLSRKSAGRRTEEQVIAANVDILFIVQDIQKAHPPTLERYCVLARSAGIAPVILLNKADTSQEPNTVVESVRRQIPGVPVHAASAVTGLGREDILACFTEGLTACFAGPSGAGKSSLINLLLQETRQAVNTLSGATGKGRHTTTGRHLFLLPAGGLVIDTPGMRELMPWEGEGLTESFAEIEALAARCRFRDCTHDREPGCEVLRAVEQGEIDERRLQNYRKLMKELNYLESLKDENLSRRRKEEDKALHKKIKEVYKYRQKP